MLNRISRLTFMLCALACAQGASASSTQNPVDRADPSVIEEEFRDDRSTSPKTQPRIQLQGVKPGASQVDEAVVVGAIRVEGATALPHAVFAPVAQSYAGRLLSPQDLEALASAVATVARDAGYGLATAWIPEQRIANGILRVVLDEGRIDAVETVGSGSEAVRRRLATIATGRPIRTAELERQLLIAGDVEGVVIGKARLERRHGKNILRVQTRQERVDGHVAIDNWGSTTVGPVRARLSLDFNGLLGEDDRLTIGGVITPLSPKEFALVRAGYSKAVGIHGTEVTVNAYYALSQPGGVLSDRDLRGESTEFELGVRHPFVRSREGSLWGELGLTFRNSTLHQRGLKVRDDGFPSVTAGLYTTKAMGRGRLRARLALVKGFEVSGATQEGDPLASRPDAGADFTKAEAWVQLAQNLGAGFGIQAQATGQIASGPLLSSEEMGLGGRQFLRAWDYRELSGDKGIAGSVELRYNFDGLPAPLGAAQLYSYVDAGSVGNYRKGFGGGTLASAGGGVRLWLGPTIEGGVEVGFPLTDGAIAGAQRDPRISFSLESSF